jgi:hypothetical protein
MASLDARVGQINTAAPNTLAAISSGQNMMNNALNAQMRSQEFRNQQEDREQMRSAMRDYTSATDDESKNAAIGKVGIVSPEMMMRLEDNWSRAKSAERQSMIDAMDNRGMAAYTALQETDPAKRSAIWNGYRSTVPEKIRGMVPEQSDDTTLTVMLGQSKQAMDWMLKNKDYQREEDADNRKFDMQMKQIERRDASNAQQYKNYTDLQNLKHNNAMTEISERAKHGSVGGSGSNVNDEITKKYFRALADKGDMRTDQENAVFNSMLKNAGINSVVPEQEPEPQLNQSGFDGNDLYDSKTGKWDLSQFEN